MYTEQAPHHYFTPDKFRVEATLGTLNYGDWVEQNIALNQTALALAEEEFKHAGGRGMEVAERIDTLRAILEPTIEYDQIPKEEKDWENDHLQFARVLNELLLANAFTPTVLGQLATGMGVEVHEIQGIVKRAEAALEDYIDTNNPPKQ